MQWLKGRNGVAQKGEDDVSKNPEVLAESSLSKTLDRGLRALEFIAVEANGVTLTEIAQHLEVHRTIAHRLIGTLEYHNLVRRNQDKSFVPAIGLVRLSNTVDRDLRGVSRPILQKLANHAEATAFLVSKVSESTVQSLIVVEPLIGNAHISYRAGKINPIEQGASGKAILAAGPPLEDEPEEVTVARERGYALSVGEVVPSAWGIAVAVQGAAGDATAAIGITALNSSRFQELAPHIQQAAQELGALVDEGAV